MTDQPNAGMSEFWNGNGGKNWVSHEARLEASLKPFGQQAMAAGVITGGQQILDIGFGCGDSTLEMADKVGPEGQVHGVDISTAMVAAAEKKRQKRVLLMLPLNVLMHRQRPFRSITTTWFSLVSVSCFLMSPLLPSKIFTRP